jgi:biopolymer transport protein TolQ
VVLGPGPQSDATSRVALDPIAIILHASGPVFVVVWLLVAAAVAVWLIAVLKLLQLRRWAAAERDFEDAAARARTREELLALARQYADAPGARVVGTLAERNDDPAVTAAVAKRAVVAEQQRASTLMPLLASIGSASPFVGLFGTVYGIMDAFLRIGREKSASLPVVAPAIGEALIATAIGLFAAIPAVVAYNAIARRLDDLLSAVEASSEAWISVAVGAERVRAEVQRMGPPQEIRVPAGAIEVGRPRAEAEVVERAASRAPSSRPAAEHGPPPISEPPPLADFAPTRPYTKNLPSYPPGAGAQGQGARAGRSGAPPPLPGPMPGRLGPPFTKG